MMDVRTNHCYMNMIDRCYNPANKHYKDYGGRGIEVCAEWQNSYSAFLRDMGIMPEGKSIERRENNGNYCKDNCYWATPMQQAQNRRIRSDNKSGYPGVHWDNKRGLWMARHKENFLGRFQELSDAIAAKKRVESNGK